MLLNKHDCFSSSILVMEASEGLQGDHWFTALIIRPPDNRAEKVSVPQSTFALGLDTGFHLRLYIRGETCTEHRGF